MFKRAKSKKPQKSTAAQPTKVQQDEYSTRNKYSIEILSNPADATVDVVFVHGLTGNRESTWTNRETGIYWPRDLLSKDLPNTRIMTFGYDADIVKLWGTVSSNTLRDHGKALVFDLAILRAKSGTRARPVIFVAHSLGGLVCEQALLISRGSSEAFMRSVLESTRAIMFMGTPHCGADKAVWGKVVSNLASLVKQTNTEIVGVLQPSSEVLSDIQQEFHTMLEARLVEGKPRIEIFCFHEEMPLLGIGKIVENQSAILTRYPSRGIHGTHTSMTKFRSADDPGYVLAQGRLWMWVDELSSRPPPSQGGQAERGAQPPQPLSTPPAQENTCRPTNAGGSSSAETREAVGRGGGITNFSGYFDNRYGGRIYQGNINTGGELYEESLGHKGFFPCPAAEHKPA